MESRGSLNGSTDPMVEQGKYYRKEETYEKDKQDIESQKKGQPIDEGWAWMILLASFIEHVLLFGSRRTFGVLYKEFMVSYDATATEVALAMMVQTMVVSIAALLVLSVGTRLFSTRVYVVLGGMAAFTAFFVNSFAKSASLLILSQGLFFGLTHALCHGPALVTLGQYFKRKRGFATLLATIGHCVGSICFPPLVQYLLVEYGLQGVLLIMSGISLNFTVAGALLRPPSFYKRHENSKRDSQNESDKFEVRENLLKKDGSLHNIPVPVRQIDDSKLLCEMHDFQEMHRTRTFSNSSEFLHRKKQQKSSEAYSSTNNLYQDIRITGSLIDIVGSVHSVSETAVRAGNEQKEAKIEISEKRPPSLSILQHLMHILHQLFDPRVIYNRLFILFIIMVCFSIVGLTQVITFLPAHAEDQGISRQDIAILLTITGSVDLMSKLILSLISDRSFVRKHLLLAVANIIIGTTVNFIHFFSDFNSMLILVVIYGVFGQAYNGLFPSILADFVGTEYLSSAMGIVVLIHGLMMSIASPIMGAIRDLTGSFDIGFHVIGACYLTGGAVLFAEPVFRRMEERRVMQNTN